MTKVMGEKYSASYLAFCRNWKTRLKDRFHHRLTCDYWPQVIAVDSMSRDELLTLQHCRLQKLFRHVIVHVPFYRDWARREGIDAADELPLERFPLVSKEEYRADPAAFQSDAFSQSQKQRMATSGTTGTPVEIRRYPASSDYGYACLWRSLRRHGLRPGDRRVYVWGRRWQFDRSPLNRARMRLKHGLRDWLNNSMTVPVGDLTKEKARDVLRRMESFRPVYLHGFVSGIYALALRVVNDGYRFRRFKLKAVVTEGEFITKARKAIMKEAFGCPILEHYGSVEFGNMAQPDPEGHFRINEDLVVIEQLESGEAAITNLHALGYPFIRYRIGDLVELSDEVPPPLPYACLDRVVGRTADLIAMPGGGHVVCHDLELILLEHYGLIEKFQIHQRALEDFELRLMLNKPMPNEVRSQILNGFHSLIGDNATINVRVVDELPTMPSGKFQWVYSDIPIDGHKNP